MDQGDEQAITRQRDASAGLVREKMLVRRRQLGCKRQRSLGGFERLARERVRRPSKLTLEIGPKRLRGCVVLFRELQSSRFRQRDAVGRRERVANDTRGFGGVAFE